MPRVAQVPDIHKVDLPEARQAIPHVHAYLRQCILDGTLSPGTKLSQVSLAAQLGISRTPLREVLRMLQEEGLVEIEPNQRTRVAGLDPQELDDIYASRILLETLALSMTIGRFGNKERAEAKRLLTVMRRAAKTGDFDAIANQLYFRQAMEHLEDETGWIKAFFNGYGSQAYGPVPQYPVSPDTPADAESNPFPFSVADATALLKANGWTINAGGTDVCSDAGTGSGQCGAGIPAGTKLAFNYIYSTAPALIGQQATDLVSQALKAGIHITLQASNFDYMLQNYVDPGAPANENKWALEDFGGESDDPYATTFGLFNTTGLDQLGDYSNPTADSLINASVSGGNPAAVKDEASFLTTNLPAMFQPNPDLIWAWKTDVSGTPASFENLTQYYATPEFWYFTK